MQQNEPPLSRRPLSQRLFCDLRSGEFQTFFQKRGLHPHPGICSCGMTVRLYRWCDCSCGMTLLSVHLVVCLEMMLASGTLLLRLLG